MTRITCGDTSVVSHTDLKNDYYSITFGPFPPAAECRPGQFVHLGLLNSDLLFRRAFSIAAVDPVRQEIELIFKVFGRATRRMGQLRTGDVVSLLGPLGVPFTLPSNDEITIIVAGGVGFPPLLYLAQVMIKNGQEPKSIQFYYGGKSGSDIIERRRIEDLGVNFIPVTEDGSFGERGLVSTPVEEFINKSQGRKLRIYACGPEGMLKAVDELGRRLGVPGQLSIEAPMPCGIGVCLGCVVPRTQGGHARVCVDGPVFDIGEVVL